MVAQESAAAIHFPPCPDGVVEKKCECRAFVSTRFHICRAGQYCLRNAFHGMCCYPTFLPKSDPSAIPDFRNARCRNRLPIDPRFDAPFFFGRFLKLSADFGTIQSCSALWSIRPASPLSSMPRNGASCGIG
jgi:hypothetical protein